jgi:2-dehydrotetronate isomerase
MPPMRFAASLSMLFTEWPFLDRPAAAAQAGFGAVECHYPYETDPAEMRRAVADARIRLLGINTPVKRLSPDDSGVGAVPGHEADAIGRFAQALDYARAAGAAAIHVKCGQGDPADREAHRTFVAHLRRASDMARGSGLMLLIEPLNQRDNPGYFLRGSDQTVSILREVSCENVWMMFDIYHVQIAEGDLLARYRRHRAAIGHVQFAGVPDRAEPDSGEVNFGWLLPALLAEGYRGWLAAEYRPRAGTVAGLGWLSRLTNSASSEKEYR